MLLWDYANATRHYERQTMQQRCFGVVNRVHALWTVPWHPNLPRNLRFSSEKPSIKFPNASYVPGKKNTLPRRTLSWYLHSKFRGPAKLVGPPRQEWVYLLFETWTGDSIWKIGFLFGNLMHLQSKNITWLEANHVFRIDIWQLKLSCSCRSQF